MKNKKMKLCMLLILLVLVICGGIAALLIIDNNKGRELYTEKLNSARAYIEQGDYNAALKAYLAAIAADETEIAPYISLAELYDELGMPDDAIKVLERGFKVTKSNKIKELLEKYKEKRNSTDPEIETDEKKKNEASADSQISVNNTLLNKMLTTTYKDYTLQYAIDKSKQGDFGTMVIFAGIDQELYYYNTINNDSIVNPSNGIPFDEAIPNYVKLMNLSGLFVGMGENGLTYEELTNMNLTGLKKKTDIDSGKDVIEFTSNGCVVLVETDKNGNITSEKAWNKIILPEVENIEKKSTVYFDLNDAINGKIIANAEVKFYELNTNKLAAEGISGSDGRCSAELPRGKYYVIIKAERYADYRSAFEVSGYENGEPVKVSMSGLMAEGQMRIVLTWGPMPPDLDSHLLYTNSAGRNKRIYFGNKSEPEGNLDIDDRNGNGPETITITNLEGTYNYYVQDFFNTGTLGVSGAKVTVYSGSDMIGEYEVNPAAANNWWVLKIENGTVTFVNDHDVSVSNQIIK